MPSSDNFQNSGGMDQTDILLGFVLLEQGLDGWTASMTAMIMNELSSHLLTSPSNAKVWDDDWEVAFRKLVQRCVMVIWYYCPSKIPIMTDHAYKMTKSIYKIVLSSSASASWSISRVP